MDLKSIRSFVQVADSQSFTKAAALLRISQPALSRQIKLLEDEFGKSLFHRGGRGISLTPEGTLLLERCIGLLNEFESIRVEFSSRARLSSVSGTVGIGIPVPASRLFADLFTGGSAGGQPGLSLRIVEGFSALIHEWLISRSIDLAILYGPQTSRLVESELLVEEDLFVVVAPEDAPRNAARVKLADLQDLRLIVPHRPHIIRTLLDGEGFYPSDVMEVDAITIMIALARARQGFTILPATAVSDAVEAGHVVALPLRNGLRWGVSICYSKLSPLNEPTQLALRLVKELTIRLVGSESWPAAELSPALSRMPNLVGPV